MNKITFAERLKEARKAAKLSQETLAKKVGRTKSTVSRWESGERNPQMLEIVELERALGVSAHKLMYGTDEIKETTLSEINRISSELDENRQEVVLNTAKEQHDEQEAERKANEPIPLHMDDEAIYGHIDRAAAWQGEDLTDEDRDAIMIALKKHLEEKAKEESEKGE